MISASKIPFGVRNWLSNRQLILSQQLHAQFASGGAEQLFFQSSSFDLCNNTHMPAHTPLV